MRVSDQPERSVGRNGGFDKRFSPIAKTQSGEATIKETDTKHYGKIYYTRKY